MSLMQSYTNYLLGIEYPKIHTDPAYYFTIPHAILFFLSYLLIRIGIPPAHALTRQSGDKKVDPFVPIQLAQLSILMYPITAAYATLTFIPPSSVSSMILPAIVCAASAYLRLWSFNTLGNLFTYSVTIRKDHSLISDGPYKWLVHPSYTGFFGCVWSYFWVWGLRDYRLWGLVVVVMTVPLVMRVWSEEKALETEFGKDKWKRHVRGKWRLVPFVF